MLILLIFSGIRFIITLLKCKLPAVHQLWVSVSWPVGWGD